MSDFVAGLADYRYFKNKGYPHNAALKIIGDRYRLSKGERNCLFRGVVDVHSIVSTQKKIVTAESIPQRVLGIDWFNVMITIESYLKGSPVFISDDGIVRDSSGIHGTYKVTQLTTRAIKEILHTIDSLSVSKFEAFLDSPISHSGDIAQMLRDLAAAISRKPFDILVVKSADYPLKHFDGIVASSDTIIIRHANSIFDLSKHVLSIRFGIIPPRLDSLLF